MAYLIFEFVVFVFIVIFQVLKAVAMWLVPAKIKDVREEIVLITGAGSGIGRLMALRFASLGATVVCVDINKQTNEATVNEIQSKDQKAFSFTCDCSSKDDIYRIANEIKANVGDVTILVKYAGIVSGNKFLEIPDEKIEKTFAVNTMAHFWMVFMLVQETMEFLFTILWQILSTIARWFVPAKKKDVRDEIVLITGAGSGIGRLMALRFASLGATVVCVDINEQANETTVNEIQSNDQKAFSFTCDCSSKDDIYRIANEIKANVGDVTILINNAGIVSGKKFLDCSDGSIQKTFEVNTLAHFWSVKAFLPSMLENNHGHIVSIASSAGLAGIAGLSDYCSSKFAAVGFNESLQIELVAMGKTGVHTTVVCPYIINTGMFNGAKSRFPWLLPILDPEQTVDKIMNAILTNRSVVIIPRLLTLILVFKSMLPQDSFIAMSEFFGASSCMDEFKGRDIKKEK